jgi:hypothetical protein
VRSYRLPLTTTNTNDVGVQCHELRNDWTNGRAGKFLELICKGIRRTSPLVITEHRRWCGGMNPSRPLGSSGGTVYGRLCRIGLVVGLWLCFEISRLYTGRDG